MDDSCPLTGTEPWREVMQRLVDAAEGVRDWAGSPLIRVQDRYFNERDKLNAALVSAEELLSTPVTAPVASSTAVDPVLREARLRDQSRTEVYITSLEAANGVNSSDAWTREIRDGVLALEHMLYIFRDDQRPTVQTRLEKLRRLVELWRDHPQAASGTAEAEPVAWGMFDSQTPPEVEAACDMTPESGDGELMHSYIEGWNNAGKLWRASITSEGIKVKEVGK